MLAVEQSVRGEMDDAILAEFRTHRFRPRRLEAHRDHGGVGRSESGDRFRFRARVEQTREAEPIVVDTHVSQRPAQVRRRRATCSLGRCFPDLQQDAWIVQLEDGIGQKSDSPRRRTTRDRFAPQRRKRRRRWQVDDFVIDHEWDRKLARRRLASRRIRRRQGGEGDVLQGPLGRDKQSLVAKLVCDRPQRHLAQRRSMSPYCASASPTRAPYSSGVSPSLRWRARRSSYTRWAAPSSSARLGSSRLVSELRVATHR